MRRFIGVDLGRPEMGVSGRRFAIGRMALVMVNRVVVANRRRIVANTESANSNCVRNFAAAGRGVSGWRVVRGGASS
jgi:hypothetical protein